MSRPAEGPVSLPIRPAVGETGVVIDGDPLETATPALLQRAGYLAVLRILAEERQEELDRLADQSDALVRRGFLLDVTDASARVEHARERRRMTRELEAAAAALQEAERALREAILDDAWSPQDDPDGLRPAR